MPRFRQIASSHLPAEGRALSLLFIPSTFSRCPGCASSGLHWAIAPCACLELRLRPRPHCPHPHTTQCECGSPALPTPLRSRCGARARCEGRAQKTRHRVGAPPKIASRIDKSRLFLTRAGFPKWNIICNQLENDPLVLSSGASTFRANYRSE
jgi:hypothetical protein